jgi:hypothetical protein
MALLNPVTGTQCALLPNALGIGVWQQWLDTSDGACNNDYFYQTPFVAAVNNPLCWSVEPPSVQTGAAYSITFVNYATQVQVVQQALAPFQTATSVRQAPANNVSASTETTTVTLIFRRDYTISVATSFTATSLPFSVFQANYSIPRGPTAVDDVAATDQSLAVDISVLANDILGTTTVTNNTANSSTTTTSVSPLKVLLIVSSPQHGTAVANLTAGNVTYTPTPDYYGADSFNYTITDTNNKSSTATVRVAVNPNGPIANDDAASVGFAGTVVIAVLANDVAGATGLVTLTIATAPPASQGNATVLTANKTISFTATRNFADTASFSYRICDASRPLALCSVAQVHVLVTAVPPLAKPDAASVDQDGAAIVMSVLSNDAVTGAALNASSLTIASGPGHGFASVLADGHLSYTPAAGYYGNDNMTYVVCDESTPQPQCASAPVTIIIIAVPPSAVDDVAVTPYLLPVAVSALLNDVPGPRPLQPASVTYTASPPLVAYSGDGAFHYTPPDGFSGPFAFSYSVCDDSEPAPLCSTAAVTITVGNPNGPTAVADAAVTNQTHQVTTLVLANDLQGKTPFNLSSLRVLADATAGTTLVDAVAGSITYQPTGFYYGPDSYIYQICDGQNLCSTAAVNVTVLPQGPVAQADSAKAGQGKSVDIDVIANDVCGPSGCQTLRVVAAPPTAEGTASVTAILHIVFAGAPNFNGVANFTYEVCDRSAPLVLCSTALVQVSVEGAAPIAVPDLATVLENGADITISVLANDVAGDAALNFSSVSLTSGFSHASAVAVGVDGTLVYTPALGYYGDDNATYQVCDVSLRPLCSSATVLVTIIGVGPTAVDDHASTLYRIPVSVDALANDKPGVEPIEQNSVTFSADPSLVTYDGAGSFTCSPPAGFSGVFSFEYSVCDDSSPRALCSTASVSVSVGEPQPPYAVNASVSTPEDISLNTPVLSYVTQGATPLNYSSLTVTANALYGSTSVVVATGSIQYAPKAHFFGNDSYTVLICDEQQLCASATVTVEVTPVGPIARPDVAQVSQNGAAVDIAVLPNDVAGPAGLAVVSVAAAPDLSEGTATVLQNQSIRFAPAPNFNGLATFSYLVCDVSITADANAPGSIVSSPLCSSALVQVSTATVSPTAVPDTAQVDQNGARISLNVTSNDVAGSAPLNTSSVALASNFSHGSAFVDADGTVWYQPASGYYGSDGASYSLCDASQPTPLCTDLAAITVDIAPLGPTAHDVSIHTAFQTAVTLDVFTSVSAGAQPVQRAALTLLSKPKAAGASASMVNGVVTYTPALGFTGADTLLYQACDSSLPVVLCSNATATFIVDGVGPAVVVLRYRLTVINYDIINRRVNVTVQTQTPAGAQVSNVKLWPAGADGSQGLPTVLSGPTTGPACANSSLPGTCDQFHRISFSDKPCSVSGASLVLSADFTCLGLAPANTCGYVNHSPVYRLSGLTLTYDTCTRVTGYGVDTGKSYLRLNSDVQRTQTLIGPVTQETTVYGRLSIFPTNGTSFSSVTLTALDLVLQNATGPQLQGSLLTVAQAVTLLSPLTSTSALNAVWDFDLYILPTMFLVNNLYYLSATVKLTFGNTGSLSRRMLFALSRNQSLSAQIDSRAAARATTSTSGVFSQTFNTLLPPPTTEATTGPQTSPLDVVAGTSSPVALAVGAAVGGVVIISVSIIIFIVVRRRRQVRNDIDTMYRTAYSVRSTENDIGGLE